MDSLRQFFLASMGLALRASLPDIGEPGQRTEAGSRGCGNMAKQLTGSEEKRLTALVPVYGPPDLEKVWGVTTAEHPTFWFYVPHSATSTYAEFVLEDAAKHQTIYKVPLAKTPGVVSISLPSTATPLEVGKPYRWYFNVYCQKDHQVTAFVEGDVQRQPLNFALKQQLDKASLRQRVTVYATHGIWYDALTTLAELRRASPEDENLATDWTNLLQSVGLESFAPVADCCKPDNLY